MKVALHKKYWTLSNPNMWTREDYPNVAGKDSFGEFLDVMGFKRIPGYLVGDGIDFVGIHKNEKTDKFLFNFVIDDLEEIVFANDVPSMLYLLDLATSTTSAYFSTKKSMMELL